MVTLSRLLAAAENFFLYAVIGLLFPLVLLLAGWWGSLLFAGEAHIIYCALGGLLAGIALDILFIQRWVQLARGAAVVWPVCIYLFYSVCAFGFFMGMPLMNTVLGPIGGYYMGMRLRHQQADAKAIQRCAHAAGVFSALVLAVFCAAALALAYHDAYLSGNIQGMLNLSRPIAKNQILILSAATGTVLVLIEYFLTRAVVRFASSA